MDAYSIFKLLHILCAIAWVGGGMTLLVNSILAVRAHGIVETIKSLDAMNNLGKTWFVPASLLTVIFGAITAALGGTWMDFWVILGLAGFASTFFTGLLIIEPTGRRIAALMAEDRQSEAIDLGQYLLRVCKFDYTVMLVVVADMVLKPTWTDLPLIAVFAATIAAGAWFFLHGGKLPAKAQAA